MKTRQNKTKEASPADGIVAEISGYAAEQCNARLVEVVLYIDERTESREAAVLAETKDETVAMAKERLSDICKPFNDDLKGAKKIKDALISRLKELGKA